MLLKGMLSEPLRTDWPRYFVQFRAGAAAPLGIDARNRLAVGPPSPSQFSPVQRCAGASLPRPSVTLARLRCPAGGLRRRQSRRLRGRFLRPPRGTVGCVLCLFCFLLVSFVLDRRALGAAKIGCIVAGILSTEYFVHIGT